MSPERLPGPRLQRLPACWLVVLPVALLAGCGDDGRGGPAEPAAVPVMALAQEYVDAWFDRHPEQSLTWARPDPDADRLTDNGLDAVARWQILQQDFQAQLDAAPPPADVRDRSIARVLGTLLERAHTMASCRAELRHVDPTGSGWLAQFMLLAPHMLDYEGRPSRDGLARISQMADYADTEIANLREGLQEGRLAPLASVRAVVAQLDFLLARPLAHTPFFTGAASAAPAFQVELTGVLRERVVPAFARYRDFLADDYAPAVAARGATVPDGEDAKCIDALSDPAREGGAALAQLLSLVDARGDSPGRTKP